MVLIATGLLAALLAAAPADLTGTWDGTITATRDLQQKGRVLTGTVGEHENDRHPITSGTIDGNTVTLLVTHARNGREFKIELTVDGDEMKGTMSSGEHRGTIAFKKRKE
jgi:hypothetical protein